MFTEVSEVSVMRENPKELHNMYNRKSVKLKLSMTQCPFHASSIMLELMIIWIIASSILDINITTPIDSFTNFYEKYWEAPQQNIAYNLFIWEFLNSVTKYVFDLQVFYTGITNFRNTFNKSQQVNQISFTKGYKTCHTMDKEYCSSIDLPDVHKSQTS